MVVNTTKMYTAKVFIKKKRNYEKETNYGRGKEEGRENKRKLDSTVGCWIWLVCYLSLAKSKGKPTPPFMDFENVTMCTVREKRAAASIILYFVYSGYSAGHSRTF